MSDAKEKGIVWKAAIGVIFLVFFTGMAISMTMAARKGSKVVDRDYYSKGLHYNETSRTGSQNTAKWSISSRLTDGELRFHLTDATEKPLAGAALTLTMMADGVARQTIKLSETAPGIYSAPCPSGSGSELRGFLRIIQGSDVMETRVVIFR